MCKCGKRPLISLFQGPTLRVYLQPLILISTPTCDTSALNYIFDEIIDKFASVKRETFVR